jgi:hypothetical protein
MFLRHLLEYTCMIFNTFSLQSKCILFSHWFRYILEIISSVVTRLWAYELVKFPHTITILIYHVKSFPGLEILAEISLMQLLRWSYKTGMHKSISSSNGAIFRVVVARLTD